MVINHKKTIGAISLLSSLSLFASEGGAVSQVSQLLNSDLFYFVYPFYILPVALAEVSWERLVVFGIMIILESYVLHRMLKKACSIVVPRMIVINLIEVVVQLLMFILIGLLYFSIGMIKVASLTTAINLFIRFVPAIMLFYARWIVACKMYAYFEPSINVGNLRRAMLCANTISYVYLIAVFIASSYVKIF